MELDEGNYFIKVEKVRQIRSMNAERYYRGVVLPMIADEMGENDHDYVHGLMGKKFKPIKKIKWPDGNIQEMPLSNADMDTAQMAKYISDCRLFAQQELRCFIPEAGQMTNEELMEIQKTKFY